MPKKTGRGPDPSPKTVKILWAKAAGICEYRNCTKNLYSDDVTGLEYNLAYVAHIIASNPNNKARGDEERSHILSDKIENLMLMCDAHHRLIDEEDIEGHPEDVLLAMKKEHEDNIKRVCGYLDVGTSEIIHFKSPIRGKVVNIDYYQTISAIRERKKPAGHCEKLINIESIYAVDSLEYWRDLEAKLIYEFNKTIIHILKVCRGTHFSVFPLAPMPLAIKLGELFGDKINLDVYQKTRMPDTWEWQAQENTNEFIIVQNRSDKGNDVVLILSLTDHISEMRIPIGINPEIIYTIKAKNKGVDCIKSELDLCEFWHKYMEVMDDIKNTYGEDIIVHLLPAMPVSAAFEVGRRRMPVYPKTIIYEDIDGFMPTITLGE